jgi:hypothetical protein
VHKESAAFIENFKRKYNQISNLPRNMQSSLKASFRGHQVQTTVLMLHRNKKNSPA